MQFIILTTWSETPGFHQEPVAFNAQSIMYFHEYHESGNQKYTLVVLQNKGSHKVKETVAEILEQYKVLNKYSG